MESRLTKRVMIFMEDNMEEESTPLQYFWNIFVLLTNDVKRCIKVFEDNKVKDEEELMFWGRVLARSVFALIEGVTYSMTGVAYLYPHHREVLSSKETDELENAYDFYGFQDPPVELTKTQTLYRIQRAFTFFARVHYADDYRLSDKPEWVLIEEIYECKQVWMHPREAEGLIVYEENRESLVEATLWFIDCVVDLLEKCHSSAKEHDEGPVM